MRISDWSSDVCSSDLPRRTPPSRMISRRSPTASTTLATISIVGDTPSSCLPPWLERMTAVAPDDAALCASCTDRSEEHTSELQSLMRISYAVFCLKKTNTKQKQPPAHSITHIN